MMIEAKDTDRLEDAVAAFETDWTNDSIDRIADVLKRHSLGDDLAAATELIRVDIERRYGAGNPLDLADYRSAFPRLWRHQEFVSQIHFEDRRSRSVAGMPDDPTRYQEQTDRRIDDDDPSSRQSPGDSAASTTGPSEDLRLNLRRIGYEIEARLGRGAFSEVYLATEKHLAGRFVVLKIVRDERNESQRLATLQHTNIVPIFSVHRFDDCTVLCMPYAGSLTLQKFLSQSDMPEDRNGQSLIATLCNRSDETVQRFDAVGTPSTATITPQQYVNDSFLAPLDWAADPMVADKPIADQSPLIRLQPMGRADLTLWLFSKIVEALVHSHARGILHSDLKPANVLIRNDGEPALLDFNLSQSFQNHGSAIAGGTLPYMSPETYRRMMGCDLAADPRADLWSVGVMMYEFLCGRLPFKPPESAAAIDLEVGVQHRRGPVVWDSSTKVPLGLRCIIEKCLAFDPADRYSDSEQLLTDLRSQAADRPLQFASEPLRGRCHKWFRRHPKAVSGGSVATLAALTALMLVPLAVRWRNQSLALEAKSQLVQFQDLSDRLLARQIVDPQRTDPNYFNDLVRPLTDRGLLVPGGPTRWIQAATTRESQLQRGQVLFRHLGHAAINAVERLDDVHGTGNATEADVVQLQTLVDAFRETIRSTGGDPDESRAYRFLLQDLQRFTERDDVDTNKDSVPPEKLAYVSDDEAYLEAVRDLKDRHYREAIELLTMLADKQAIASSLRWTMLARAQRGQREFKDALLSFTQSIERSPDSPRLWYLRGRCQQSLKRFAKAESDYHRALQLDPAFVSARWSHAQCLMALGQPEEALQTLNTGLQHRPENLSLTILRSQVQRQLGNTDASKADYAKAVEGTPESFAEYLNRAKYRQDDDLEGKLADLLEAKKLRATSPEVHYQLAAVHTKLGDLDAAIASLDEVRRLNPSDERAMVDTGVLLARSQETESALQMMDAALQRPNSGRTLYQAACICSLVGDNTRYQRGVSLLASAIHSGYGVDLLRTDSDLDALRRFPGFAAVGRTAELVRRTRYSNRNQGQDEQDVWDITD
ncbi:serine/threonine-protein kinase [Crateriforma conspicua]|uniref:Serine/threonine-protein kinase PrkC n=1 Tax=Crateriforma conspicua TaxID=2527996 RepID=A0A5C6FTS7_9PLAN|nr:serine/threonine-protein kinase [Crateriforma conspicua]TWU65694.1 Serine/threonine-protein kinase PrkC [Crateriforma conspicua]